MQTEAAWTPRPEPGRAMLACLGRGGSLDFLPEGFNEVPAPRAPAPPARGPHNSRPAGPRGGRGGGHGARVGERGPCRGPGPAEPSRDLPAGAPARGVRPDARASAAPPGLPGNPEATPAQERACSAARRPAGGPGDGWAAWHWWKVWDRRGERWATGSALSRVCRRDSRAAGRGHPAGGAWGPGPGSGGRRLPPCVCVLAGGGRRGLGPVRALSVPAFFRGPVIYSVCLVTRGFCLGTVPLAMCSLPPPLPSPDPSGRLSQCPGRPLRGDPDCWSFLLFPFLPTLLSSLCVSLS